ncbi:MAG: hypothetical protein ACJAYU_001417 [Bradymonadia bacterium]|jgi:hypothetical protein
MNYSLAPQLPFRLVFALMAVSLVGCESDDASDSPIAEYPTRLLDGETLNLAVWLVDGEATNCEASDTAICSLGLQHAAEDLVAAAEAVTGVENTGSISVGEPTDNEGPVVIARLDPALCEAQGPEDYRITWDLGAAGHIRMQVVACAASGASYGLYQVIGDLGVRYHHPEESWFPQVDAAAELPSGYVGELQSPSFVLRGFHEHTQHPIIASDWYMRPDAGLRGEVSNYIRWLARNRQNVMSWHMLKTVELNSWFPYVDDIIEEAHAHGIQVGLVTSFVDQQQNNFRLIIEESGETDEDQLDLILTRFADAGFDFITTQIGSSEFSKPADEDVLRWLDYTAAALDERGVRHYAWIHTTCELKADDGTFFFHLPERSDPRVGAWVHTTMFYDMTHPAPVYGCEDFSQQLDFIERSNGEREQVYFPETAWWLGFDNNAPFALPLTGWTRSHDITQALAGNDVTGHITFTSGREWTYWQYDHFLTRATWDRSLTWDDYIEWIGPIFGEASDSATTGLRTVTELQRRHFFDDDPFLYFYISGERQQDELGVQAGIVARPSKVPFSDVVAYDDQVFSEWKSTDFAAVAAMRAEYRAAIAAMHPPSPEPGLSATLYAELRDSLHLFALRVEHAHTLYSAMEPIRTWRIESAEGEDADSSIREAALTEAEAHLAAARTISSDVLELIAAGESRYRYDVSWLARAKPESLTSYAYGYLEQAASAHFWTRRDDQLELLIGLVFETIEEAWQQEPEHLFVSNSELAELTEPDNPVANATLTGFVPDVLFGLTGFSAGEGSVTISLDYNSNRLPDPASETLFEGGRDGGSWSGTAEVFVLTARSQTGEVFGDLLVLAPTLELLMEPETGDVTGLLQADLAGDIPSAGMIALVVTSGGIDEEGVTNLLKTIFSIPFDDPLPETLPMAFRFGFELE